MHEKKSLPMRASTSREQSVTTTSREQNVWDKIWWRNILYASTERTGGRWNRAGVKVQNVCQICQKKKYRI